ncbi:MAG: LytTR family DNA-binding domain-containing protein [Gammaproteobacteria bacterium]|jgi:two-component system response regulator AlgR|nr:LytTR family DNA-binding domain-containing protein [Gammaproteobacteria bacterium]
MADGNLRLLIVDDEAPARARLRTMLDELGGWSVVGEADTGPAALELAATRSPDVVLLDIRMPGMDGLEVARRLAEAPQPAAVVFTTAYDEYAVNAFETNAVSYLLKPVRRERLLRALERAARSQRVQALAAAADSRGREVITVSRHGNLHRVPVSTVRLFSAEQKYVRMEHQEGADLLDESLKALEEEFVADFVRVHRQYLVRIDCIERLQRRDDGQYVVQLHGVREPVPVSRRHVSTVKTRLR